jgi:hypothetical protein
MGADDVVADLEEYCEFGEDRVYLFLAIARSKENPGLSSGSEPTFREVVRDEAGLRRKYDRLRRATRGYGDDSDEALTFRLYVTANARNAVDAFFDFRERTDGWVRDRIKGDEVTPRKFKRVDGYWKSELQKPAARDETRFVFDLDDASPADRDRAVSALSERTTVATCRETPNGYHVVADPFNYNDLHVDVDYELKTDGLLFVTFLTDPDGTAPE